MPAPQPTSTAAALLLLVLVAVVIGASGCNVVRMTEHRLERRYARAELTAQALHTQGIELAYRDGGVDSEHPLPSPRPTLVVWGEHDPVFPLDAGRRLSKMLDATLVVIPDARHAPNMEHPEAFNRALIEFLDQSMDQ